ncbi:MAG: hypothetical protein ABIG95_02730 [Candidatus Woesearchaeota archaeon]
MKGIKGLGLDPNFPILPVLLAALSAWYFGWVTGRKESEQGIPYREIIIEGQSFRIPAIVYDAILGNRQIQLP